MRAHFLELFICRELYSAIVTRVLRSQMEGDWRSKEPRVLTHLYGMIRRQFMPFPLMKPVNPSSLHMRTRLCYTPLYCLSV